MGLRGFVLLLICLLLQVHLVTMVAIAGDNGVTASMPREYSGVLLGDGFTLNYTLIARPFVDDRTSLLFLYVYKAYQTSYPARLDVFAVLKNSTVGSGSHGFSRVLEGPVSIGYGLLNVTSSVHGGLDLAVVNVSISITPIKGSGGVSRSMSLPLGFLSSTGSVPRLIVYGSLVSLLSSILIPITLFFWNRGRKRLSIGVSLVLLALLIGFPAVAGGGGSSGPMVLRYIWVHNDVGGEAYVYKYKGLAGGVNLSLAGNIRLHRFEGCRSPFCFNSTQAVGSGYYYHNALREALLVENDSVLGFYSRTGVLFSLYNRESNTTITLNASRGFNPPVEASYYAKLFLAPPLVSTLLSSAALAWSRRR